MEKKKLSAKAKDVLWVLAMTLGLAVMGLLVQLLSNRLEEYVYTHRIVRYWAGVVLACAGAFGVWKGMNVFRRRNPFAFQTVQTALLLVMLILNIYVMVEEVLWNFSFSNWQQRADSAYADGMLQASLLGSAGNMETVLPDLFLNWEDNGVVPALGLGYGLTAVGLYVWLAGMWLFCALVCMRLVNSETYLVLYAGDEVQLELDVARVVYLTALLALVPKVLFQTLSAVLGVRLYYGGTLFSPGDAAHLAADVTQAGIPQLLTMAYLLYLPGIPDPEAVCALPVEETGECREICEPAQTEEHPAAEATEEPAELPRELTAEDFARAEYTYEALEWDDEGVMPYFHVPGGWYYMTAGMIRPERMPTGQSVLVGRENYLRRMDPEKPGRGEHLYWV